MAEHRTLNPMVASSNLVATTFFKEVMKAKIVYKRKGQQWKTGTMIGVDDYCDPIIITKRGKICLLDIARVKYRIIDEDYLPKPNEQPLKQSINTE